ncbi:MAG: hypothetical protein ACI9W4_002559, partial [Rhodothermales bacterium]
MYKVSTLLVAVFFVGSAAGQTLRFQTGQMSVADQSVVSETIHLTDLLANSPRGQESLAEYHRVRKSGQSAAKKSSGVEAVGSVLGFQVFNHERGAYDDLEFTLKVETTRFNIWVETAELISGRVTDA